MARFIPVKTAIPKKLRRKMASSSSRRVKPELAYFPKVFPRLLLLPPEGRKMQKFPGGVVG
jgi:hypothetical protein